VAGFVTPMVEPTINAQLAKLQNDDLKIEQGEYRAVTFAILLLGVAILASVFDGKALALPILIGGLLGLFGMRLFNMVKKQVINKPAAKDSTSDPE